MSSVREFVLPDLGEGLTEAQIVRWLVQVGDAVAVDQPVVEVETAKTMVALPCPYQGVVHALYAAEGESLDTGSRIMAVSVAPSESAEPIEPAGPAEPIKVLIEVGDAAGRDGPVPVVSPAVRELARAYRIELSGLSGGGPDGLIRRADVDRAIGERRDAPTSTGPTEPTEQTRIPLRGALGLAAEKFSRSRREIPDVTCWLDADATALVEARLATASDTEPPIPMTALLARMCTAGLARHPRLNARVDTARAEIVQSHAVHLGIALHSGHGLLVPVIRNAERMSTARLGAELRRLSAAADADTLSSAELTGSTFTVNNYGTFGVDGATPILNYPEAAMLGVGRIAEKPWVVDGALVVRKVVQLSLTFDHRVCDGREAAAFLRFVADLVEHPLRLLSV